MRRFTWKISNFYRHQDLLALFARKPERKVKRILFLEPLEDRFMPATTTGSITGFAYVEGNANHVRDAQEAVLPGITINLTGSTNQGTAANASATTDATGAYTFTNVAPGTYQPSTGTSPNSLGGAR